MPLIESSRFTPLTIPSISDKSRMPATKTVLRRHPYRPPDHLLVRSLSAHLPPAPTPATFPPPLVPPPPVPVASEVAAFLALPGGAGARPPGAIIGRSFGGVTATYTDPDRGCCGSTAAGRGCDNQEAWKSFVGLACGRVGCFTAAAGGSFGLFPSKAPISEVSPEPCRTGGRRGTLPSDT